jgi:hypothetical protein
MPIGRRSSALGSIPDAANNLAHAGESGKRGPSVAASDRMNA